MNHRTASLRAAIWMTGAIAAFTAMGVAGRELAGRHDVFEIQMYRSAIGFVLVCAGAAALGQLGTVSRVRLGGHLFRNLLHFTGQNLWFWALTLIPLAQVFALEFTMPVWVLLLAALILGERLTRPKVLAAALGLIGIVIITRPFSMPIGPGVIAAALSALFFAMTSIQTKRLSRTETVTGILFWLTAMQFLLGLAVAGADGAITLPGLETAPWLALIGVAGLVAHLSLTSALHLAPASFVAPLDFLRLPIIAVVAAFAYAEPLDPFVLAGGAVIFAGIWLNLRAELGSGATPQGSRSRDAAS